jgi:hypothetical protein
MPNDPLPFPLCDEKELLDEIPHQDDGNYYMLGPNLTITQEAKDSSTFSDFIR